MSGAISGVQTRDNEIHPYAYFIHGIVHQINITYSAFRSSVTRSTTAGNGNRWQPRLQPANQKQHPHCMAAHSWAKSQRKTITHPTTWNAGNAILSHSHISTILPGNAHLHASVHLPKQSQSHAWYPPSILLMCGGLRFLSMWALEE